MRGLGLDRGKNVFFFFFDVFRASQVKNIRAYVNGMRESRPKTMMFRRLEN